MALELFAHPFSSYCQKALIALYENDTPFAYRLLDQDHPDNGARFAALWPVGKFPLLVDAGVAIPEATIIVEHLDLHHPGATRFLPGDPAAALTVRALDRFLDLHLHQHMQAIVSAHMPDCDAPDAEVVAKAEAALDIAYAWLEAKLDDGWLAGEFGLADCAAAPALFYADWVYPIPADRPKLRAYRARLNARPSIARAIDEALPYRHLFPPGAPDRD